MATLDELRVRIDSIDDRILELLAERAEVALEVAHTKRAANATQFHDPERERRVLTRLQAKGAGRFPRDAIRVVFREVMSACLALEEPMKVAFPGTEGAFAEVAARHLFGLAARYRETGTIEGVFDAVRAGEAACGVVPVESSTDGSVTLTADALIESDLQIRQELVLDVAYCLFSKAEGLSGITRVHGHSHALSQCRLWLAKHLPGAQIIQTVSAAAAAHEAVSDPAAAAVGNRGAGELYGLPLLRERIHDRPENATRFIVIAPADAPPTGADKTSLVFSVQEEPGALRRVLAIFDDAAINLTRIESRPSRQKHWDYVFLVDLEGHRSDPRVGEAVERLRARCEMVKVLGSYPRSTGAR
ncbi:prephenate dehydratase [Sorangium sp. So ce1151]|uniref:prephenate dehydratase n=1 Tax=unclassified Sorangium TaxID=2621164 RepID=UPI003F635662